MPFTVVARMIRQGQYDEATCYRLNGLLRQHELILIPRNNKTLLVIPSAKKYK